MKAYSRNVACCRLTAIAVASCIALALSAAPAWAVIDYNASLGANFSSSFSGGLPTANPFGANLEWQLRGPNGLTTDLTAVSGGIPASGQAGWCQGTGGVCAGAPTYSYFQPPWQPGVTIVPGIAGHGPQDVLWTAPANVDEGGVTISGAIEQMFETNRRMRLRIFKNGSATAATTVDALPPIVDGVVLQKVNFGPISIAVSPGDTLQFAMDGGGTGGTGVPTFVAWNVQLDEVAIAIPEPASIGLLVIAFAALCGTRQRD